MRVRKGRLKIQWYAPPPHARYMVHILLVVIDFVDCCQIRLFAITGTALVGSAARNKHCPEEQ